MAWFLLLVLVRLWLHKEASAGSCFLFFRGGWLVRALRHCLLKLRSASTKVVLSYARAAYTSGSLKGIWGVVGSLSRPFRLPCWIALKLSQRMDGYIDRLKAQRTEKKAAWLAGWLTDWLVACSDGWNNLSLCSLSQFPSLPSWLQRARGRTYVRQEALAAR